MRKINDERRASAALTAGAEGVCDPGWRRSIEGGRVETIYIYIFRNLDRKATTPRGVFGSWGALHITTIKTRWP